MTPVGELNPDQIHKNCNIWIEVSLMYSFFFRARSNREMEACRHHSATKLPIESCDARAIIHIMHKLCGINTEWVIWFFLAIAIVCLICGKFYAVDTDNLPLLPRFNKAAGITVTTEIHITREGNR